MHAIWLYETSYFPVNSVYLYDLQYVQHLQISKHSSKLKCKHFPISKQTLVMGHIFQLQNKFYNWNFMCFALQWFPNMLFYNILKSPWLSALYTPVHIMVTLIPDPNQCSISTRCDLGGGYKGEIWLFSFLLVSKCFQKKPGTS